MNLPAESPLAPDLLIVDDAPEHLYILQGILEEAGYRVRSANSGWAGLELALAKPPDLILLDRLMPNLDGKAVLKTLLEDPRTRDVPVIFLTLLGGDDEIAACLDAGARDYLQKPFQARELLARVRAQLEWKRCRDRERTLQVELNAARTELKLLAELVPVCPQCKQVRDDPSFWQRVEVYLATQGQAPGHATLCLHCQGAPQAQEPSAAPAPWRLPAEPAAREGGQRILLVEDDPGSLHILIQLLRADYKLMVTTHGAQALELASQEAPDLILLDVVMADLDGHQVCRALKQNPATRDIPVIFVTGQDEEQDEIKGLSLGAVDYIVKPFSLPIILQRVRTHLALKACRDLLERQSMTDNLTELPNRRHLQLSLDFIWRQAQRHQTSLAVILMDVDHFKGYNDHYGHPAGDACLQALARALGSVRRRSTDLLARFGGEEFICLLPGMGLTGALAQAEAMRRAVAALCLPHAGSTVADHVTLSLGVAVSVPAPGDQPAALIEAADLALYEAKRTGRNRVMTASHPGQPLADPQPPR